MHHLRLKKALGLVKDLTDPVEITTVLLQNEFTDAEVTEVIVSLETNPVKNDGQEPGDNKNEPGEEKGGPAVQNAKATRYQLYDLWQVEIGRREVTDPMNRQKMFVIDSYTAIKQLRTKVKLEENVVADLNAQSHNSSRRYYKTGTITNGNTEKVNLTTAAH